MQDTLYCLSIPKTGWQEKSSFKDPAIETAFGFKPKFYNKLGKTYNLIHGIHGKHVFKEIKILSLKKSNFIH